MANLTYFTANTTDNRDRFDLIGDLLRTMQVSGSLLLNECYLTPWAISIPNHKVLTNRLGHHSGTHIATFHLVQRGSIEIELESGIHETAYEGEIVICYSGQEHTIYQGSNSPAQPFEQILQDGLNIFTPSREKEAQSTSLLCGIFQLQDTTQNPLFGALPPILKISTKQLNHHSHPATKTIVELFLNEVTQPSFAHGYIVERYLELLCAVSISSYIESIGDDEAGWLHAIKDPIIARVINAIHAQIERHWSVATMAEISALSPSRFAARFTQTMGMSPMAYVTQWRMYVASKQLNRPLSNIKKIAAATGYENTAAFSRTFKRTMGISPGAWRANHRRL